MAQERRGTSHADRVMRVLRVCHELPGDVQTLQAIAEATGFDPSVCHRILQSCVADGYVERLGHGKYRLGSDAIQAGLLAMAGVTEHLDQHQILLDLQEDLGGIVVFYSLAPVGARRVATDYAKGDYNPADFGMTAFDMFTVGCSLRTGASGRTLLAYVPEPIREIALAEPIPETAGPGAMDNEELLASIKEIRKQGYAIGRQECLPGWDSVAVPALWGNTALGVVLWLRPVGEGSDDVSDHVEAVSRAARLISLAATAGGRNPSPTA
ncbi:IclR family transcriptional regulator C-terminal domain-containing protein [Streptomyces sp. UNOC14_S4]|uniref:MarR family transcriptional regulator n=1 Tax=Streptomyces sp. UNOC14_S4 TaxID=2872340 RepID=UPI001E3B9273|nr:IclR family transcriptional regulator C-terminal domain-containing protein [Streptomyces sp. UNOC14_S4]MCC3767680.1 helix-turn-helix domain-containing protein [Streptomyces sp. UNOC14_S4]